MDALFEEIDSQPSAIGTISLRRRRLPALGDRVIYEVKLGDEYLMSSAFVEGEIALADLALAELSGEGLRVVVGGLGLGYTAEAVLKSPRVADLAVVEALDTVIQWHRQEQVPLGKVLNEDERCRLVCGDFFARAVTPGEGFDGRPGPSPVDAILLDIDHSPSMLLHDGSNHFYTPVSLSKMKRHLSPGGIFAMWSNEAEEPAFSDMLRGVFPSVACHRVEFDNPFQGGKAFNSIYIAR